MRTRIFDVLGCRAGKALARSEPASYFVNQRSIDRHRLLAGKPRFRVQKRRHPG
jgi:hypothetical protein